MEQGGFGILPSDIMTLVVHLSSVPTATSIALSCKYWFNKYKHIIGSTIILNQDRIVMDFPKRVVISKGRVLQYSSYLRRKAGVQCSTVIGSFRTTMELVAFLEQFNKLLITEPSPSEKPCELDLSGFWMQIQNGAKITNYSLDQTGVGVTVLKDYVVEKLYKLVAASNPPKLYFEEPPTSRIKIRLFERNQKYLRDSTYYSSIEIYPQGDVALQAGISEFAQDELYVRTSEEFYKEMRGYLQHPKHKSVDISIISEAYTTSSGFFASYIQDEGESYSIAEYEEFGEVRTTTKVLARRQDLVRKFAKALENGIYGSELLQNPHHNNKELRKLPPTTSILYSLARRIPYCLPLFGLQRTYQIFVKLARQKTSCQFFIQCSNNGRAPIEEILELFEFVESNLDLTKTYGSRCQVGDNTPGTKPMHLSVEIRTLSNGAVIKGAKTQVIKRIWSFCQKYYDIVLQ